MVGDAQRSRAPGHAAEEVTAGAAGVWSVDGEFTYRFGTCQLEHDTFPGQAVGRIYDAMNDYSVYSWTLIAQVQLSSSTLPFGGAYMGVVWFCGG